MRCAPLSTPPSGKDVVLGAETGSGKTLAYLLPIVNQIIRIGDRDTGRDNRAEALVLTPTQVHLRRAQHAANQRSL